MVHFVMKTESIPASLSTPFRLHNITLSAHPLHRKFCKEWETQQLYHNTPFAFRDFPIVPVDEDDSLFKLDIEGMSVNVRDCSQYTWPVPMEMVRFILRHHMNEIASTTHPLEAIEWTLLQAQFQEADRCVFVLRQVEADELYTVPLHKIYNVVWMDLRQLPDGRTLSRTVNFVSTHLVESGMGSLDEFAKVYDVDTSLSEEEDKVEVIQEALSKRGAKHRNIFRTKLNALVKNLRHDFTSSRDASSKT
ncbi:hypothetical protein AC1031_011661 [Aphanomyces cochlioides]|nr:hypothetical protein AC1031_011661 [Aphanomyces cochlioides]